MNDRLLDQSSRVAMAAYLHDLGKFSERARLDVPQATLEKHVHIYCPKHEAGGRVWHTHKHAAYSAISLDIIEGQLPSLVGKDVSPFGSWDSIDVDDSFINAVAMHHRPITFLQWVVATADRLASGFERQEWEDYNKAEDTNHYRSRLLPLLAQLQLGKVSQNAVPWRMPLAPLSPDALFPVAQDQAEPVDNTRAQQEYRELWEGFKAALEKIPESHRESWPLWLDHFDTLWQTWTHAIPAATAFGARPDVSLYDHSRASAAMATALWRYHHETGNDGSDAVEKLRKRADWDDEKFLLVQGDFFGIQKFIFSAGAETNKKAAKLLRGRSFYISLLTQCAALKLLERLALPATSQIINAAGKFMILAPNTDSARAAIRDTQKELDDWFTAHTWGECHIGLASVSVSSNAFLKQRGHESPFRDLMDKLHQNLEQARYRAFSLAAGTGRVLESYLEQFDPSVGACKVNSHWPADSTGLNPLSDDMIKAGTRLGSRERLLICRESLFDEGSRQRLKVPVFGYHIHFTGDEQASGKFGPAAKDGRIRRFWDYSLPDSSDQPLWKGYARRNIGAWLPLFDQDAQWRDIYSGVAGEAGDIQAGEPKTLQHLACEDRLETIDEKGEASVRGIAALGVLKGDIDNLGALFNHAMQAPSFARMAGLSRQIELFFSVWLPWRCRKSFPNTYTVFAGGDDFFMIGPWRSQIDLARTLRQDFQEYCANPAITFSAGISTHKPSTPIPYMAESAEEALERAKHYQRPGNATEKNGFTLFEQPLGWEQVESLREAIGHLDAIAARYKLSTGWIYGLLDFADMAGSSRPEDAMWRSRFAYRNARLMENIFRHASVEQREEVRDALNVIGNHLNIFKNQYRAVLHHYLYSYREQN